MTNRPPFPQVLRTGIERLGFVIISSNPGLPLVTFHLSDDPRRGYDEFQIADRLRMYGWVVPAYTLARDNDSRKVHLACVCVCVCVCAGGGRTAAAWGCLHSAPRRKL